MKISEERQRKILDDAVRIMEHHAKYSSERIFLESPEAVVNGGEKAELIAAALQLRVFAVDLVLIIKEILTSILAPQAFSGGTFL